jgi:hypothetical protein
VTQACGGNIYDLTKRQLYDIFTHVIFTKTGTASMLMAIVRFSRLAAVFATKTAKNSGGTGGALLFFRSPERRRPRISAEHEILLAVNSWQKQQKTAR